VAYYVVTGVVLCRRACLKARHRYWSDFSPNRSRCVSYQTPRGSPSSEA